jgi:hypothetical protein
VRTIAPVKNITEVELIMRLTIGTGALYQGLKGRSTKMERNLLVYRISDT